MATPETTDHVHPVMNWLDYLTTRSSSTPSTTNLATRITKPCPLPSDFPNKGTSYWIANHSFPLQDARTTPSLPPTTDLAIIGAGMVGATAAYQVSSTRPNTHIALLDARGLCSGATGRNGGHVSCHEAMGIRDLAKIVGEQDAIRIRRMFRMNRDLVLSTIKELGAAARVDLNLSGSLVCFGSDAERLALVADIAFCRDCGWEPEGEIISPEEACRISNASPSTCKYGAWYLARGGTFHARKMVDLLLSTAAQRMPHLNIQSHTPVTKVGFDDSNLDFPYEVQTNRGVIRARKVLHATNAYARALIPELCGEGGVYGVKGAMIGVRSVDPEAMEVKPGFLHTYGIHYCLQRPRTDGQAALFLYGHGDGEGIEDFDDSVVGPETESIKEAMYAFLSESLPQHFPTTIDAKRRVEYDWAGIMGSTKNGCSIVGRVSPQTQRRGEYLCVAHNGEGMCRCFALATVTTQAILADLEGLSFEKPEWFPNAYARNF